MPVIFKFVNLSDRPIAVPDSRGSMCTFQPGGKGGTTNPWFSRFVNPKQLTRIPVQVDEKEYKKYAEKTPLPPVDKTIPLPVAADEETKLYTRKAGIYRCKVCEGFSTASRGTLEIHMKAKHNRLLDGGKPSTKTRTKRRIVPVRDQVDDEAVAVSTILPAEPEKVSEQLGKAGEVSTADTGVTDLPDIPDPDAAAQDMVDKFGVTPEAEETAPEEFACTLCERKYKSEKGLKIHMTKTHSD